MISILCPTRARPKEFQRMVNSAMLTAHNPDNIRILYFVGNDDPNLHEYPKEIKGCMMFIGQPWSAVMASNYLAGKCQEHFPDTRLFMVGSDDMVFATPEWDKALIDAYQALGSKAHAFSFLDSRDDRNGTPHPILTKEFIDNLGYFLPPIFLHWFVDTWIVGIAKANKCFTHLKDYLLVHDKPSDQGKPDQTHCRIRALGWHDRDTYVNQTCQHYLMMEKERMGRAIHLQNGITDTEVKWLGVAG